MMKAILESTQGGVGGEDRIYLLIREWENDTSESMRSRRDFCATFGKCNLSKTDGKAPLKSLHVFSLLLLWTANLFKAWILLLSVLFAVFHFTYFHSCFYFLLFVAYSVVLLVSCTGALGPPSSLMDCLLTWALSYCSNLSLTRWHQTSVYFLLFQNFIIISI